MKKLIEDLLFLAHSDEARQAVKRQKISLDIVSETSLAFEALAYEATCSSIRPLRLTCMFRAMPACFVSWWAS